MPIMSEWWRAKEDNEINSERRTAGDRRKFAAPQKIWTEQV